MKNTGKFHYESITFNNNLLKAPFYTLKEDFINLIPTDLKGELCYHIGFDFNIRFITNDETATQDDFNKQKESLKKLFKFLTNKDLESSNLEIQFRDIYSTTPIDPKNYI